MNTPAPGALRFLQLDVFTDHPGGGNPLGVVLGADQPCLDEAIEAARRHGFFFGGLFPRWFGADGVMLQQVLGKVPDFAGIRLYEPQAKDLLKFIEADWRSVDGHKISE